MAEEENKFEDITIVDGVASWHLRSEGNLLGTYSGIFKFRCYLTPLQKIAAGREQRALLGESRSWIDTPTYEHEAFLAYALSQLKYRIISAPPFWTTAGVNKTHDGDIPDEEIIEKIFEAAINAELKYKNDLLARKEAAIKLANEGAKLVEEETKKDEEEGLVEDDGTE